MTVLQWDWEKWNPVPFYPAMCWEEWNPVPFYPAMCWEEWNPVPPAMCWKEWNPVPFYPAICWEESIFIQQCAGKSGTQFQQCAMKTGTQFCNSQSGTEFSNMSGTPLIFITPSLPPSYKHSVFSPDSCDDGMRDLLLLRKIRMLHWLEPRHLDIPLHLEDTQVVS